MTRKEFLAGIPFQLGNKKEPLHFSELEQGGEIVDQNGSIILIIEDIREYGFTYIDSDNQERFEAYAYLVFS